MPRKTTEMPWRPKSQVELNMALSRLVGRDKTLDWPLGIEASIRRDWLSFCFPSFWSNLGERRIASASFLDPIPPRIAPPAGDGSKPGLEAVEGSAEGWNWWMHWVVVSVVEE